MTTLKLQKVTELPAVLTADTMYLIKATINDPMIVAVTDSTGTEISRTMDSDEVELILMGLAGDAITKEVRLRNRTMFLRS